MLAITTRSNQPLKASKCNRRPCPNINIVEKYDKKATKDQMTQESEEVMKVTRRAESHSDKHHPILWAHFVTHKMVMLVVCNICTRNMHLSACCAGQDM